MLTHPVPFTALPPLAPAMPVTLRLRPTAEVVHYAAVMCWETYAKGEYHTATITKHVALALRAAAEGGYELDLRTSPPALGKPEDQQSLEQLALRLAALYEWLVIDVAPTGRFRAVRNYDAVYQTWESMARALQASTTADDNITPSLLQFVGQQLQDPGQLLASLRHDYLYQTLVFDRYEQPLAGPIHPGGGRQFASFFDKLSLSFTEDARVELSETGEPLTLRLQGAIDPKKTDVGAITRLLNHAVGGPATSDAVPRFHYAATYVLDPPTGLPLSVELTVYARLLDLYNKEYTLTLTRV